MMATLNEILDVPTTRPEVRDIEGFVTQANRIEFPATHAFKCGNDEKEKDTSSGGLPVPQQWGLRRKSEAQVAEMIERYIDFVDDDGRSVHMQMPFVRHFMQRDDGVLPVVVTVGTLPIVCSPMETCSRRMESTGCAVSGSKSRRKCGR